MGETILDILFRNNQPVAAVPGGSSFNSIISIGRTGVPCSFIGYTGGDRVGQQIIGFMQENNVDTQYFEVRQQEKAAVSLAFLDDNGDAQYVFHKEIPSANAQVHMPSFQPDDCVLFGSYYAVCSGLRPQVRSVLDAAQQSGAIVYYDLNFRQSHQHELEALLPNIHSNFRQSTIVRGSADDFQVMYGLRDARAIYHQHIAAYCPLFICTAGAGLVTVCTPTQCFDFQAPQIDAVVSTVGAGDNFNAGFLYALIRQGVGKSQMPSLSQQQWQQLIDVACAFAGQACRTTDNYISHAFAASLSRS